MWHDQVGTGRSLFTSVFSDAPIPDVEAAIVVAHPGDEALGASWVMVRFQERASVYCLMKDAAGQTGGTVAAAAVAGVPAERCHNLGLSPGDFARDLETLVWLTTAAVTEVKPRVFVTHACEGRNLAHDATAFAVYMTARLLTRSGSAAPVIVEIPAGGMIGDGESTILPVRGAVKIEFGFESRKVKRRMLQCHATLDAPSEHKALTSEAYMLATETSPLDNLAAAAGPYADTPTCLVEDFRRHARNVATSLSLAVLSTPSRV
jgi:LmbE family N-acetylglucosaminyl deacetylase